MGGVGLVVYVEFYLYLYLGYLVDVKCLWIVVFGKLKVKGGFSGSILVGVLFFLVYYVNEDFFLNIEWKMWDVLMDIVIDGVFFGGV